MACQYYRVFCFFRVESTLVILFLYTAPVIPDTQNVCLYANTPAGKIAGVSFNLAKYTATKKASPSINSNSFTTQTFRQYNRFRPIASVAAYSSNIFQKLYFVHVYVYTLIVCIFFTTHNHIFLYILQYFHNYKILTCKVKVY